MTTFLHSLYCIRSEVRFLIYLENVFCFTNKQEYFPDFSNRKEKIHTGLNNSFQKKLTETQTFT